jgi:antitoxin HicB
VTEGKRTYSIPVTVQADPDGGFAVRSPVLPELVTEGDTLEEALENAKDAALAVLEIYEDLGKSLPAQVIVREPGREPVSLELAVAS